LKVDKHFFSRHEVKLWKWRIWGLGEKAHLAASAYTVVTYKPRSYILCDLDLFSVKLVPKLHTILATFTPILGFLELLLYDYE